MAADGDGQQGPSKRRRVDAADEALRESQAATHRLLGAIDDAERDLQMPEHERTASWEAKYLSDLEEVLRAAESLGELPNPLLDIPPRSKSD